MIWGVSTGIQISLWRSARCLPPPQPAAHAGTTAEGQGPCEGVAVSPRGRDRPGLPAPGPPALSLPQERPVEVGDWRKNVEAMSGMEGRKKMFDAAKSPTGQ